MFLSVVHQQTGSSNPKLPIKNRHWFHLHTQKQFKKNNPQNAPSFPPKYSRIHTLRHFTVHPQHKSSPPQGLTEKKTKRPFSAAVRARRVVCVVRTPQKHGRRGRPQVQDIAGWKLARRQVFPAPPLHQRLFRAITVDNRGRLCFESYSRRWTPRQDDYMGHVSSRPSLMFAHIVFSPAALEPRRTRPSNLSVATL